MLKKLTNYLKKEEEEEEVVVVRRQVNSARELHCSLFLSEQCTLYIVHVNCIVH